MYVNKIRWLLLVFAFLLGYSTSAYAVNWRMTLGGRINTYFDIDNDELDPDHIPIWFQSDFVAREVLADLTEQVAIDWFVGLDDRRNTVSSVEKQQNFMPGMTGWKINLS
ncbi:hypothetical protein [Photobacterium kasasachensis]|uniref:hypothetical protein n=1 Tax=Photobacterium kasasachensis TaxID=2910240 RepID=UPI003D14324C